MGQDKTVRNLAESDDEAAIRALEDKFTAGFNSGDIEAIMQKRVSRR
jgi:ketosteroid isomerase-like protein